MKIKAAICGNEAWQIDRVFGQGRRERLAGLVDLIPGMVTSADFPSRAGELQDVEVLFSTWGMDESLARMVCDLPNLKAVFYAAGTVRHFARPLLDKGVVV